METIADGLRSIYKLIEKGQLDNALWEITDLEENLRKKCPGLIDKYHLKTYFSKWRTRLLRTNAQGIQLVLSELDLLIRKLDQVVID
ncbi:hypothetical protein Desor_3724 [Desulfosporosinus orientis DSM 765]|uniref:Uncharacterized protein n=1 Tax=Desulfosporosinus orientis (strain ATCC 19365 / DSM 765 / NCIMB 8382 / VKM B-1628 / Singapore I) TaxID=768706 RepID=G7W6Q9_DESOD|nr:hypothetical protein [Desulfosporosinus orientis]AET69191.1 hypothetical protein Desor_3724 [Desulfosporosinus orientis DSM 765]